MSANEASRRRARLLAGVVDDWAAREALLPSQAAARLGISPDTYRRISNGQVDPGNLASNLMMRIYVASGKGPSEVGFDEAPAAAPVVVPAAMDAAPCVLLECSGPEPIVRLGALRLSVADAHRTAHLLAKFAEIAETPGCVPSFSSPAITRPAPAGNPTDCGGGGDAPAGISRRRSARAAEHGR